MAIGLTNFSSYIVTMHVSNSHHINQVDRVLKARDIFAQMRQTISPYGTPWDSAIAAASAILSYPTRSVEAMCLFQARCVT